jgi:cysteine sulfinate desulfinase/cysteine desulfurase-like protein
LEHHVGAHAEADCQQRWVVKMDRHGFAVSTGSACASGKEEPSHVLSAMGYENVQAGRLLRFSSGWETTESDWMQLLEGVIQVSEELARVPGNRRKSESKRVVLRQVRRTAKPNV